MFLNMIYFYNISKLARKENIFQSGRYRGVCVQTFCLQESIKKYFDGGFLNSKFSVGKKYAVCNLCKLFM